LSLPCEELFGPGIKRPIIYSFLSGEMGIFLEA
jgi:hypothetical protein